MYHFFSDVKNNLLARITEPNNDDYDNDGSDNCDHNFGTFDDFVVKMAKKYHIGKPSIVKKETNCDIISQKKGGGWRISYLYFIFPNTL